MIYRLADVITRLGEFNPDWNIYAVEPWTADSSATVEPEPEDDVLPPEAAANGMTYFLMVEVAVGFASVHKEKTRCSDQELVARVIHYARYDA